MLKIEHLSVRFGATAALEDVSLDLARGEILCLLGPSGSGKSTLLRVVAGVERATRGRIAIADTEVEGPRTFVEPEDRRVGMVFQDYALFPHLTVAANVAFGLVRHHRASVPDLLERLGLRHLANSYPHMLSGGERQRVALARAMAPQPRILLMDEPFSSLDSRLRDEVRRYTLALVRESCTSTVIVTHDPDEALRTADRIALLDAGRLVQVGSPEELYRDPHSVFAARFFSDVAAVRGTCRNGRLETPLGSFSAPGLMAGTSAIACIRPQHLRVSATPTTMAGRILSTEFRGETRHVLVSIDGLDAPVAARVMEQETAEHAATAPGATIYLEINAADVPIVVADPRIDKTKPLVVPIEESLDVQQNLA